MDNPVRAGINRAGSIDQATCEPIVPVLVSIELVVRVMNEIIIVNKLSSIL